MGSIFMLVPAVPFAEALVADGIQGKAIGAAVGEQDPCLCRVNLLLGTSCPIGRSWLGFSSLNHPPGRFWYFKSCAYWSPLDRHGQKSVSRGSRSFSVRGVA